MAAVLVGNAVVPVEGAVVVEMLGVVVAVVVVVVVVAEGVEAEGVVWFAVLSVVAAVLGAND